MVIPIVVLMVLPEKHPLYSFTLPNIDTITIDLYAIINVSIFIIASITDWADGYLSRKNQWISEFGKILDPIADKVLINSILILFAYQNKINVIFTILFISRDTIVDAIRMMAAKKQLDVAANIWGKCKTVAQMLAIILIFIIGVPLANNAWWYWGVQNSLIYIALFFSLLSGVIYINNYIKVYQSMKK